MPWGSVIISKAQVTIQDKTGIRWSVGELAGYVNDGLREIATLKPSSFGTTRIFNLVAGSRQTLSPNTTIRLIRPIKNMRYGPAAANNEGRRVITAVPREVLDSQNPDWQDPSVQGSRAEVIHITYDPDDPLAYYVFPPNNGNGHVELLVARIPDPMVATGPVHSLSSYQKNIDCPQVHLNALVDYVCFRAYSKDNDVSGNVDRAALHYQAMAASLGIQTSFEVSSNPNTTGRSMDLAT